MTGARTIRTAVPAKPENETSLATRASEARSRTRASG